MRRRRFRARLRAIKFGLLWRIYTFRQLGAEIDKALADRHRVGL